MTTHSFPFSSSIRRVCSVLSIVVAGRLQSAEELPWRHSTVDPEGGFGQPSLAFGPDGRPAIAYANSSGLHLARFDGTTWTTGVVDSPLHGVGDPWLAFAADGQPVIAYNALTLSDEEYTRGMYVFDQLRLARFNGSAWNVVTIAKSYAHSLAFGPDGQPAIAYVYGDLYLARFSGTAVMTSTVARAAHGASLAFGPDGLPTIAYAEHVSDGYPQYHWEPRFAQLSGTAWNAIPVAQPGIDATILSFAFGPTGQPAIAYDESIREPRFSYRVRIASFDGARWNVMPLDTAEGGNGFPLVFAPDGRLSVAYTELANTGGQLKRQLRFAQLVGTTWVPATVVFTARYPSLAFGPDGQPAIAYVEEGSGKALRFAQRHVPPPVIIAQPQPLVAAAGSAATLSISASGSDDKVTYQWQRNGADIPGATAATYMIPSAQTFHAGEYSVIVGNEAGSVTSTPVTLRVAPTTASPARLLNVSNRGLCGSGDQVLIAGFVISSDGAKTLLVRAVGPTLAAVGGLSDVLADPQLTIYRHDESGTATPLLTNDDWGVGADAATTAAVSAQVGAFLLPAGSKDAALVVTLPPGIYTVVASGVGEATGPSLVEVYEVP